MENYCLSEPRYEAMNYRRCGRSGLLLPEISLGFWHNFGEAADPQRCRAIVETAFDNGITYFDLANNYGPPAGSAEEMFGRIFDQSLRAHRDEILVATKAGHDMWPGPYGEWSSRKSLVASLDQSLRRLRLDYVDIFYSHRPDPDTPLEETMQALVDIVRSGKALYAGISKYPPEMAARAYAYLRDAHVPCLVYQGRYNMLDREPEAEILSQAAAKGVGFVAFSPLAQGLLTDRYLNGIPDDSRMRHSQFLRESDLTPELLTQLRAWNEEARAEGLSLAQYALRWILRRPEVTSVIVGASSVAQLQDSLKALKR
ncbi:L-glyceraldehyde 3-phosphate reductase [Bacteroidales bacterium WCE2004]|nr:L-glyceraldehyde 3-phosphate reductase [Bacteroidales bacterium WCE2004]